MKENATMLCDLQIASIEEIIQDAKLGKLFILMDNENRENEGDLVIVAEKVTPEAVNTMIRYGSGIICLTMKELHMKKLNLNLMPRSNVDENYTAFTTSIDARYGITTGVSAEDRAHTILTATHHNASSKDLVTPGHIFPLIAKEGGVLVRSGHTEASVDIAMLAGCEPIAVVCELMNENGTMSRLSDVVKFAKCHNINITTIDRLIEYLR